jgi:hypothetical protein
VSQDIVVPASPLKTISRYLLLSPAPAGQPGRAMSSLRREPYGSNAIEDGPQWEELAESRLALAVTATHVRKTGATAGFSSAEAAQASEVTIVGDRIPEVTEQALRVAGCQVNRLAGKGYALVASFTATGAANAASLKSEAAPSPAAASDFLPASQHSPLGKSLGHYVLFGPPAQPATLANLLLVQDYLLAFGPCFGFAAGEASYADMVTIVGDATAVSQQIEDSLRGDGATVQRISGTVGEVAAAFAIRIAAGRPLV